jgi:6-phosphogluconolactonase
MRSAVAQRGRCHVALAGGGTPRRMYKLLAADSRIRWSNVHLYWGDERYVPHDHPASNFRMAQEALLTRIEIPSANVHPMPTDFPDPREAAQVYEAALRAHFGSVPRFDLIILGLGADGHTASLFANSAVLHETERWVVAVTVPADPPVRLTLTLAVINGAAQVHFLVTGRDKADALRRARQGSTNACPASMVRPTDGTVTWWADRDAAARC